MVIYVLHLLFLSLSIYVLSYPVRCAHNPPPCRIFFSHFLKSFFLGFSWFRVTRFSWFWVILEARGSFFHDFWLFWETWGPIWKVSWIFVILETFRPRKGTSFLRSKCDQEPTFCSVVFQCFFECQFFLIFCNLGCPGTPFWEAVWIIFPAEARKRKSVFGLHRRVRIAYPAWPEGLKIDAF